jgi:hypothetical protein
MPIVIHWYYFLIFQNYYKYSVHRFYEIHGVSFFKSFTKFKLRDCNQMYSVNFIKKTEQSETTLRNFAVHCSPQPLAVGAPSLKEKETVVSLRGSVFRRMGAIRRDSVGRFSSKLDNSVRLVSTNFEPCCRRLCC